MKEPLRIQRKRTKGFKMPENTVYVGRPTRWGNKYIVREYKSAYQIFRTSKRHGIVGMPVAGAYDDPKTAATIAVEMYEHDLSSKDIQEIREQLSGKNLACFCKEGEPCHADVLLKIANS